MINKKMTKVIQKVLYVWSAVLAAFSFWAFITNFMYVQDAIKKEQLDIIKNLFAVINYIMNGFMNYLVFAAILASVAWIMGMILKHHEDMIEVQTSNENDDEDEDEDEDEDDFEEDDEVIEEKQDTEESVEDEEDIEEVEEEFEVVEDVVDQVEKQDTK